MSARFATDHGRALLAYLAIEADRPHARAYLAFLLWPDQPEPQALNNLRQTLIRLRQTLGLGDELVGALQITPKTLQFNSGGATLDARRFQQLLTQCKTHAHRSLERCAECMQTLEQAAQLYKGEFLQGVSLRHSQPFNEWAIYVREELHHQMISVLQTLATYYEDQGDYGQARGFVARQLALEPWQEEAHCQMMRVLAKGGQRTAAILQYETCRRILYEELGIAPSSETTLLYERIKADTLDRASDDVGVTSAAGFARTRLGDLPAMNHLVGRSTELAQLDKLLTQEQSKFIMVLGMGGIGKTSLAVAAVQTAARHYDLVLWRSLLNAPTLQEIVDDFLKYSAEENSDLPEGLDARLALLLHHLQQRRCLLILDNVESIFYADQAGHVRPEYAGYTQLFQQVAEGQHKSCLLLTSREQLHSTALLNENLPGVHTLQLDGLDVAAAQALLIMLGLTVESSQAAALVNRYSGNPLALKLVAETIQEVFGGDIGAFLSFDAVIFDDIRAVLEQQFSRLPALEQEILLWIAVEREPVSLETLRGNLAPARPMPEVVQAVRALQRRSLLQRANRNPSDDTLGIALVYPLVSPLVYAPVLLTDTHFTSPNVILEYLIDRLVQAVSHEIEQEQLHWLHAYSLMQAQAKEYVRQSQVRLILRPIASRLETLWGRKGVGKKLLHLLAQLRAELLPPHSYAAGNLLNLLLLLEIDVGALDLAGLAVWQADLRLVNLPNLNLAGADLSRSRFADAFGIVHTTAVSPDGKMFAAGTNGGEIRLWNAANGQLIHIYKGHKGAVRSIAFRPDGKILASSGEDHRLRLWSVADANLLNAEKIVTNRNIAGVIAKDKITTGDESIPLARILEGHSGRVMSVAFHPNGKMLASASTDRTVRLWDGVSGETRAVLNDHEQPVWAVAFSPDGQTLASSDVGGVIYLWDAQTAELRTTLSGHSALVSSLAFDPKGDLLASGSHDYTVCVWDVASGEKLYTLSASTDTVSSVVFSPDGTLLASTGDDHTIRMWEAHTGSPLYQLHGHSDAVCEIAFSPDGRTLVSVGTDHVVGLWDLQTMHIRYLLVGSNQRINSLAFHPNGKLLASGHYDSRVRLWDVEKRLVRQTLHRHTLDVTSVAFSNDGTLLASASGDKSIHVWTMPMSEGPVSELAASESESKVHHRFHLRGHQRDVTSIAFLRDGKTLLSSSEDQTVGMWDLESGQPFSFQLADEEPLRAVKSHWASDLVATITDHSIRLWHAAGGELCKELPGHTPYIWSIDFSPNGEWLASGGSDGSVALWDIRNPTQASVKTTLRGHRERVFVVVFSPDGRFIASAGADQSVCLWDAQTHQLLHTLRGHTHWVGTLAFSADGQTLASGGMDETIHLWDVASGQSLAVLHAPGPYAGMNISGATGISEAERTILKQLGAVE